MPGESIYPKEIEVPLRCVCLGKEFYWPTGATRAKKIPPLMKRNDTMVHYCLSKNVEMPKNTSTPAMDTIEALVYTFDARRKAKWKSRLPELERKT